MGILKHVFQRHKIPRQRTTACGTEPCHARDRQTWPHPGPAKHTQEAARAPYWTDVIAPRIPVNKGHPTPERLTKNALHNVLPMPEPKLHTVGMRLSRHAVRYSETANTLSVALRHWVLPFKTTTVSQRPAGLRRQARHAHVHGVHDRHNDVRAPTPHRGQHAA